jgi:hypothetical protein
MRASLAGRVCVSLWLIVAAGGCESSRHVAGVPKLAHFLVQVPNETDLDLLAPSDGGVPAISGAASLRLIFDRLLAGDKIETVSAAGPMARTDVVTATWVNAPAGAPPIVASTLYDPSGSLGVNIPGPKIMVSLAPGLPSGAQVSVKLDRTKITSKAGEPFEGPDVHTLNTQPFAASLSVPPEGGPANLMAQLTFTNVPAADVLPRIKVTGGVVQVEADPSDPRRFNLLPMSGWNPGHLYTVTVDKDAADRFGVKLGADFVAPLSIWPTIDAGVADASAPDAAAPGDGGEDGGADAAAPTPGDAQGH